jgi:hypothetical protein
MDEGPNSLIEIIVLAQFKIVMFDEGGNWGGRMDGRLSDQ